MNAIRNFFGLVIVVIGAFVFQIGYIFMTDDMQERFAVKLVDRFAEKLKL